jgi:hypothetical protein
MLPRIGKVIRMILIKTRRKFYMGIDEMAKYGLVDH